MTSVKMHSRARANARLVLVMLADRADDYGIAWPSVKQMCKDCLIDRTTIMRHLARLEKLQELESYERPGTSNVYRIMLPGLDILDEEALAKLASLGIVGVLQNATPYGTVSGGNLPHQVSQIATRKHKETKADISPSLRSGEMRTARTRSLSLAEQIADKHLEAILAKVADGFGYDLADELQDVWTQAWQYAVNAGANPKQTGMRLIGAYIGALTDDEASVPWSQIGRLVGRFGKLALFGVREALTANVAVHEILPYATRVCENKKREIESTREESGA